MSRYNAHKEMIVMVAKADVDITQNPLIFGQTQHSCFPLRHIFYRLPMVK